MNIAFSYGSVQLSAIPIVKCMVKPKQVRWVPLVRRLTQPQETQYGEAQVAFKEAEFVISSQM